MTNWTKFIGPVTDKQRQWRDSKIRFRLSFTGKWPPTFASCSTSFLSVCSWLDSYAAMAATSAASPTTAGAKVKIKIMNTYLRFQRSTQNLVSQYLQPQEISSKIVRTQKRRDRTLKKASNSAKLKQNEILQESKMKHLKIEGPWWPLIDKSPGLQLSRQNTKAQMILANMIIHQNTNHCLSHLVISKQQT